ncbi:MAG: hypothetical protein QNK04_32770 [Myxococcota bacterium]|nr:hypothetical protein [Myxococcota bacterium]
MPDTPAQSPLDRLAAFRAVYLGLLVYVVLSVTTLQVAQNLLREHFQDAVEDAARVSQVGGPVVPRIQQQIRTLLEQSPWTRYAGVRVNPLVLGADARTPIYLVGITPPPPPSTGASPFEEAHRLLPAIVTVEVEVPVDSLLAGGIFVGFGAVLIPLLFVYHRSIARREDQLYNDALAARDATVERARSIQTELEKVRDRLVRLEPAERGHVEEIARLQGEREGLQRKLDELGRRERSLRDRAVRYTDLERERRALEDLLDEAVQDMDQKDQEIRALQDRLKTASHEPRGGRSKATEQLGKRMRTLYRNLEVEDRALDDMVALGNESLRLRAEEALKRLDDDPDTASVRRKVGGLPSHLHVFELGFAGKFRVYYTKGEQRPFKILAVGGKASQKQDLEYLSRL